MLFIFLFLFFSKLELVICDDSQLTILYPKYFPVNPDDDEKNWSTEEKLCRCILYQPNKDIFLYINEKDSFIPRERTDDVLRFKLYNMGLSEDPNDIYQAKFFNYKLCFIIIYSYKFELNDDYIQIYLPWWLSTRWVKRAEWNIQEICRSCFCTIPYKPYIWEVHETRDKILWTHYSNESTETCSTYNLVDKRNGDFVEFPYWIFIDGYRIENENNYINPGFIFSFDNLNDTFCSNRTGVIKPNTEIQSSTTQIYPTSNTQICKLENENCLCLDDGLQTIGWLMETNTCIFKTKYFKQNLPKFFIELFIYQEYICDETAFYYLNDSHMIECTKGYQHSIILSKTFNVHHLDYYYLQLCDFFLSDLSTELYSINDLCSFTNNSKIFIELVNYYEIIEMNQYRKDLMFNVKESNKGQNRSIKVVNIILLLIVSFLLT